jgi:hypothetical protein
LNFSAATHFDAEENDRKIMDKKIASWPSDRGPAREEFRIAEPTIFLSPIFLSLSFFFPCAFA